MSNTDIIDQNKARMRDTLTLQQASAEYGIPVATLRTYRAANRGPESFRLAGRVLYSREAFARWVAAEMAATTRGGI